MVMRSPPSLSFPSCALSFLAASAWELCGLSPSCSVVGAPNPRAATGSSQCLKRALLPESLKTGTRQFVVSTWRSWGLPQSSGATAPLNECPTTCLICGEASRVQSALAYLSDQLVAQKLTIEIIKDISEASVSGHVARVAHGQDPNFEFVGPAETHTVFEDHFSLFEGTVLT